NAQLRAVSLPPSRLRTKRCSKLADVRFGSKADIGEGATDVRFTPNSGHRTGPHHLRGRPHRVIFEVDTGKLVSVVIVHEAGFLFFDGPRRREAASGHCLAGMYAGRGHTTPSTSENDVVIKICNLIEIKFFFSNRDSVLEDDLGNYSMKRRQRNWTAKDVSKLKKVANKRTRAVTIARTLKRTEGATRQKAFSLGLSLETRASKIRELRPGVN